MSRAHTRGMKFPVMSFIIGLMAEKVAVRSGPGKTPVAFKRPFPHRERDGAVRKCAVYGGNNLFQPVIRIPSVLSALQDEGAEPQLITGFTAGKNILFCQPVAVRGFIAAADAAVVTVVPAVAGEFDQPPDKNIPAIMADTDVPSFLKQIFCQFRCTVPDQAGPFIAGKRAVLFQPVDQRF